MSGAVAPRAGSGVLQPPARTQAAYSAWLTWRVMMARPFGKRAVSGAGATG